MPLDMSSLFPQFQGAPQVQMPMTQDVSGGASIGPVPLGINAGPVGALQQMQNYAQANQAFQGNMDAQKLDQANAQNTYENLLKNNPLLDSQRDLAMSQLGVQKSLYADHPDLMKEAATSDVSKTIAGNYAAASASQQQEMESHYTAAVQGKGLLEQNGYNPDPKLDNFDYSNQKLWDQLKKTHDVGNVTGLDSTPNRADAQRAYNEGTVGIQTKEQLQKLGLGQSTYVQQVGADNAAKGVGEITVRNQGVIAGMLAQQQVMLGNKLATAPPQEQARYTVTQTITQTGKVTPDLAQKWISANEMDFLHGDGQATFKANITAQEQSILGEPLTQIHKEALQYKIPGAEDANWTDKKTIFQFMGPLAIAKATDNLDREQAKAFKNNFASYPFETVDGTKRLGDASVDEILHSAMAPGAAGATATQAVQKNPVLQGTAPVVPPQQAPNPLTRQAPVQLGQGQPNVTMQTDAYDPGPKAPPGMDTDHVLNWLVTNPANRGIPLPELQKRAILHGILMPKNPSPSQPPG